MSESRVEPKIAVQLVSYNSERWLPFVLESIASQDIKSALYFFDNASSDQSASILKKWLKDYPTAQFIIKEKNVGFAAAHNELFKLHEAPYVVVLNPDVKLPPNYFSLLLQYAESHPRVGSLSGLLLKSEFSNNKFILTNRIDSLGLKIFKTHRVTDSLSGEEAPRGKEAISVFGVSATAAMYNREALKKIQINIPNHRGVFDDIFFSYKEDVDLAYRLMLAGFESVVLTSAVAYHARALSPEEGVKSAYGGFRSFSHWQSKNRFLSYLSYRNHLFFLFGTAIFTSFWVRLNTFLFEFLKFFAILITHPSFLKAWGEVFKQKKYLKTKRREVWKLLS